MRLGKIAASAVVLAFVMVPLSAAPASAATLDEFLDGLPEDERFWVLDCPGRVGNSTLCTPKMWDDYLDLYAKRLAAGLPVGGAPPSAEVRKMMDDVLADTDIGAGEYDDLLDELEARDEAAKSSVKKPNFTPSTSKPRAFMLNVLGSMLGSAMPTKWQAEQLANQYRYNHSWEGLNAQFGQDPANPNYHGQPDKYDDYVIRKYELDKIGGTNGRPLAPPVTKPKPFIKGLGGVAGGLINITALPIGTMIGNGISHMFGLDVDGLVCQQSQKENDVGKIMLSLFTGVNCGIEEFPPQFLPNTDVDGEGITDGFCISPYISSWANTTGVPGDPECRVTNAHWRQTSADPYELIGVVFLDTAEETSPGFYRLTFNVIQTGTLEGQAFYWGTQIGQVSGVCLNADGTKGTSIRLGGAPATITAADGMKGRVFTNTTACPYGIVVYATNPAGDTGIGGTTGGIMYKTGVPMTEIEWANENPQRYLECRITGDDGQVYTAVSEPYTETEEGIPGAECPALPEGVRAENVTVDQGTATDRSPVYDEDVIEEYAEWWDNYPECRTGACKLDLIRESDGKSCFDLEDACASWFESPTRDTDYQCRYGTHDVDLDECYVYSGIFVPGRIEVGAPYADPLTGEWSGGQANPTDAAEMMNTAPQNPDTYRTCLETGWSATPDPINWVFTPIRCALEWAFVPRTAIVVMEGMKLTDKMDESAPGQLAAMFGGWSITPQMSGCSRHVEYPTAINDGVVTVPVWDVCPGSWAEPVGIVSRVILNASATVLAIIALRRAVAGMVDYSGV